MAANVPLIPMTCFADYLIAPGGRRIALVKQQISQLGSDYSPGKDFYRPVQRAIREDIQFGTGTTALERAVSTARSTQARHFRSVADGVGSWVRTAQRGKIYSADRWDWQQPSLTVRINPDFVLERPTGDLELVKVYFKEPKLERFQADALLRLMQYAIPRLSPNAKPVVLDARRGRAFAPTNRPNARLNDYLRSEALGLGDLWNRMIA